MNDPLNLLLSAGCSIRLAYRYPRCLEFRSSINANVKNDMISRFQKITYSQLNARQKENYNYQKISSILADYGFSTIRLSDDWKGADFIAQHISGETLKVQLKGRLIFSSKYRDRDLWISFPSNSGWYLYPHDKLLVLSTSYNKFQESQSWLISHEYTWPSVPKALVSILQPYFLPNVDAC